MIKRLGILIICSGLMILNPGLIRAQTVSEQPMNLTLSPISVSLETDPGIPVTTQIKVRNNQAHPEKLELKIGTFKADETGERPILLETVPDAEFLSWLTPSVNQLTAPPGEWVTFNLTFAPPTHASLNYYYTVYLSRTEAPTSSTQTVIQGSPAILVLTTVKSPYAQRALELESFSLTHSWSEFLPQQFLVKIKNTGNVHVVPAGNIFIDGQGQKDVAVLSLNPNGNAILPQSSRTFSVTWEAGFPRLADPQITTPPTGIRLLGLDWNFSQADQFRIGPYTAHLLLVYDNGERDIPIESFANFWILPWKLLILFLTITLFTVIGLFSTGKKIWRLFPSKTGE